MLFPLCLAGLSLGIGLLVERASGIQFRGALLPPLGLAGMIVIALPLTLAEPTAQWITPVIVAVGLAGLTLLPDRLGHEGFRLHFDAFAPAAAVLVFAAYAAPFVATGETTLGGYVRLDDTASWLAITDWVAHHGVHLGGLPPSTYQLTLKYYLGSDYPVGGLVPLMIGDRVFSSDLAWLYQPYLAFVAAMLALALYVMVERAIPNRLLRLLAAVVASQSALLFGYVLWGGFKEPATAATLALVGALLIPTMRAEASVRHALPAAVAAAAVIGVASVGGGVWLLPMLAAIVIVGRSLRRPVVVSGLALILSIPSLTRASFLDSVAGSTLQVGDRIGNLIRPLSALQVLGVWPVGDFRLHPGLPAQTDVILVVVGLAAVGGFVATWRHRDLTLVVYGLPVLVGCALVVALGSAWIGAKALAIASPVPLLAAFAGAAALLRAGRRTETVALVAVIAGGVVWSNVLAYGDVALAPHNRFQELHSIGNRVAGEGPTLMTEYEPYGVRWFLRDADPEGASDLRFRPVPLLSGKLLAKGQTADIDAFKLQAVVVYRTLVLRRSPLAGRPPAPYKLIWTGRYYEVWQRPVIPPLVRAQIPTPICPQILRLHGRLAASIARTAVVAKPDGTFTLDRRGLYGIWLQASFGDRVDVYIDGRRVSKRTLADEPEHDASAAREPGPARRGPQRACARFRRGPPPGKRHRGDGAVGRARPGAAAPGPHLHRRCACARAVRAQARVGGRARLAPWLASRRPHPLATVSPAPVPSHGQPNFGSGLVAPMLEERRELPLHLRREILGHELPGQRQRLAHLGQILGAVLASGQVAIETPRVTAGQCALQVVGHELDDLDADELVSAEPDHRASPIVSSSVCLSRLRPRCSRTRWFSGDKASTSQTSSLPSSSTSRSITTARCRAGIAASAARKVPPSAAAPIRFSTLSTQCSGGVLQAPFASNRAWSTAGSASASAIVRASRVPALRAGLTRIARSQVLAMTSAPRNGSMPRTTPSQVSFTTSSATALDHTKVRASLSIAS